MRALNIIGIITSVGIFRLGAYVNNQLEDVLMNSYGYYQYENFHAGMKNIGLNTAFFMILLAIFFLILYIVNIKNNPHQTVKVFSILGIIGSVLFILINVFYISSGSSNSLPGMYVLWMLFGLVNLAFTIVLLVQAVRQFRRSNGTAAIKNGDDVVDNFDVE